MISAHRAKEREKNAARKNAEKAVEKRAAGWYNRRSENRRTERRIAVRSEAKAMVFRKAVSAEAETVAQLYRSVLGSEFCVWNEEYPTLEDARHDLQAGNLYVLADGGSIVGALSVVEENELDELPGWSGGKAKEIARVVIGLPFRGKGLAGRMVREIVALLRESGSRAVHLSVAKQNLPAYQTYCREGFSVVGEAELYGGEYYLMEKML